jgi:hypothetical protein
LLVEYYHKMSYLMSTHVNTVATLSNSGHLLSQRF